MQHARLMGQALHYAFIGLLALGCSASDRPGHDASAMPSGGSGGSMAADPEADGAVIDAAHAETDGDTPRVPIVGADVDGGSVVDAALPGADAALPSGELAEALAGHWFKDGPIGNCFTLRAWYSFEPDGRVVNRSIDDNACSGLMLVAEAFGRYRLEHRLLTMTFDGAGSEQPFEMAPTTEVIAAREQRLTIAFGERAADGARFLDGEALVGDGAQYASERYIRLDSASGGVLFEQDIAVSVNVDPPLPLPAGASCRVELTFALSQRDAAATPAAFDDSFSLQFDATVRESEGWLQVVANEVGAVAREEAVAAWEAMLAETELEAAHSSSFVWTFRQHVFPALRFREGEPEVLSVALPEHGSLQRSADPPPLP